MESKKLSFGDKMKESFRKFIVSLKHKPHMIPMVMMAITFLYYSLNLTHVSNATASINKFPMGLCGFVTMLFSMLALVCFMNAFPNRKPVNKMMLIIMLVMVAAILAADAVYLWTVIKAVLGDNPVKVNGLWFPGSNSIKVTMGKVDVINQVMQDLWVHVILMLISLVLLALLPVYSKLLRKIDTNIEVEAGNEMGALDAAE